MSVTNELLHGKIPMQMYALGAQSGTTVLYHSWAGLAQARAYKSNVPRGAIH